MSKLVIDGNNVYEIDEECLERKGKEKQKPKKETKE